MPTALRDLADAAGLLVGAAAVPQLLRDNQRYRETLAREFNAMVAENCMKFMYLQPERGRFDFTQADYLVAFTREHNMRLRGHTLVWHNQVPAWIREGSYTRAQALDILQEHIFTVLGHFRGQAGAPALLGGPAGPAVFCWDVVNEALSDEGGWREKSFWFETIGPDYLEYAFRWAHEADPGVTLFYNDYGMELPGVKPDACYRLLRQLLRKNVPVHGVGFQGHLGVENRLDPAAVGANLRRFQELGLEIHFTEADMGIKQPTTPDLLQEQAAEYANRLRIALATPAVKAFVLWGFTDAHSWIPAFTKGEFDDPLLFDRDYQPKPAYEAICEVLGEGTT